MGFHVSASAFHLVENSIQKNDNKKQKLTFDVFFFLSFFFILIGDQKLGLSESTSRRDYIDLKLDARNICNDILVRKR